MRAYFFKLYCTGGSFRESSMKNILMTCVVVAGFMSIPTAACASEANSVASDAIMAGNWTKAETLLRKGLAQNPQDATRLLNLAFVLQNTGRQAEATRVYEKVLQLSSNPVIAVADPYTLSQPARAKRVAKKGMASIENAKR
jgi:tetratricopeptide (TPR) repeat protein